MAHELNNSQLKRDIECTTNSLNKLNNYKSATATTTTTLKLVKDNKSLSNLNTTNKSSQHIGQIINAIKRSDTEQSDINCNSVCNRNPNNINNNSNMLVKTSMNHNSFNNNSNTNSNESNLMLLQTSASSTQHSSSVVLPSHNNICNRRQTTNSSSSVGSASTKNYANRSNKIATAINSVSPSTTTTTVSAAATAPSTTAAGSTKMGSRRIFTPQFKLQVLDSYRNDSDCKGNQRATARKYGIHRRQIQKWLQCESTLRSSVANSVNNQSNVKHQFHNVSSSHVGSKLTANSQSNKMQSNSVAAAVAAAATAAAESTQHHLHQQQQKLTLDAVRHHNSSLMRPIPIQHDKNNNTALMTPFGNEFIGNSQMASFLPPTHHLSMGQHRQSAMANSSLPTNSIGAGALAGTTMPSGFAAPSTQTQSINLRSACNLVNNDHAAVAATKSHPTNVIYNVPTLQPYSTINAALQSCSSNQQSSRMSPISTVNSSSNNNNTHTPDNSSNVTRTATSAAATEQPATTETATRNNTDQNINVSIPIPILPTPRLPHHHQHSTIHHLSHPPQHYPYSPYQYLHPHQIPLPNSHLPIQLHHHHHHTSATAANTNHQENVRLYVPPSVSLPIISGSHISAPSNATSNSIAIAAAERLSTPQQQIIQQNNNAQSLRTHQYADDDDEKVNSTGNAITYTTYRDYQIENGETCATAIRIKSEKEQQSNRCLSPIDLSIGGRKRSSDQQSDESEEIQVDVCEDEGDSYNWSDVKPAAYPSASAMLQYSDADDAVVDLSCRKRKLFDSDQQSPPQKIQKTEPKPVKLFKPYLLDDDDTDDVHSEPHAHTDDDEKFSSTSNDHNPVIWSHFKPEYDAGGNLDDAANNFLHYHHHHQQQQQQLADYPSMLGSPNFQSSNLSTSGSIAGGNATSASANVNQSESSCRSTIISGGVLSPRSPNGFWNCPKGSPVSGYETASIYSDCSDYHNNNATGFNSKAISLTLQGAVAPTAANNAPASNDDHHNAIDVPHIINHGNINQNSNGSHNEESKIISFKRNHIQRWLEHDSASDNGKQAPTLYT